jgi:hypothetical protein
MPAKLLIVCIRLKPLDTTRKFSSNVHICTNFERQTPAINHQKRKADEPQDCKSRIRSRRPRSHYEVPVFTNNGMIPY